LYLKAAAELKNSQVIRGHIVWIKGEAGLSTRSIPLKARVEEKDQKTGTLKVVTIKNPTTQFVASSDLVQEVCSAEALQHLHSCNYDTAAALKSFVPKAPKLDFDTCTLVDDHVAKRKHPDKNGWNAPFTRRPDVKKMQGRIQQDTGNEKIDIGTLVGIPPSLLVFELEPPSLHHACCLLNLPVYNFQT